jgi:cation diffusion facilitator CzcD-associated flavoprotein CzcO
MTAVLRVDVESLRERYRQERVKRTATGSVPYTVPRVCDAGAVVEREVRHDDVDVAIVGGGFGGLLAAARLRAAGIDDVWIIEKASDFGGTWFWNRYPGARCDVDSYVYLPLLEELGYLPSEKYVGAPEILAHSQAIARRFGLYERAFFNTAVSECRWDEAASRWDVITDRGDKLHARFLCTATGPMHRPKLPDIPGRDSFRGHSFHTMHWDYDYTGGDHSGGLTRLYDKRVGVIGTGASAVQCIPHLGVDAGRLFVFQRTPPAVGELDNQPTDRAWAESLQPGWQQRRMENFNNQFSGVDEPVDLVDDVWTAILRAMEDSVARNAPRVSGNSAALLAELADFEEMERVRDRIDAIVADPFTAAALKPYYGRFCRRPCFHNSYLETFNRPNVSLIDTDGKGVDRITESGVVVGDRLFELDCLIYATGFETGAGMRARNGFETFGRDSTTLTEKYADGLATFHGMHSRGFPNMFAFRVAQAAVPINYPHLLNEQSKHLAYLLRYVFDHGIDVLETTQQAEDDWVATIVESINTESNLLSSCGPLHYSAQSHAVGPRSAGYGRGSAEYFAILEQWRAEGTLRGLDLSWTQSRNTASSTPRRRRASTVNSGWW